MRNLAKTSTPTVEITKDGDQYSLKTVTAIKTSEIKFELGKEFEEDRMDGKKVKTVVNAEGNKLIQTQFGDKEVKIVREFNDKELKVVCLETKHSLNSFYLCFSMYLSFFKVCTVGPVVSTRVYNKL